MEAQRLLHYQLIEEIGKGGMGVVWKARDTKLERNVAIKILPEAFARDGERLARFEREARVLASLENHPNVAAIHGLERADGIHFLVLELVEGQTLEELLRARRLPLEEALDIAKQVAQALDAAHSSGIIHRDLKPANIKVTPGGRAKVLDFGLAKAAAPEAPIEDGTESPTVQRSMTQAGVVVGTPGYMSPEQWRGQTVDKRSDIWAFGCVVYEMVSGRKGFPGETISDIAAAVLTAEPDWSRCPSSTPPSVRRLLRRCLQKDPDKRLHDIADARIEIEDATVEREAAPPVRRVGLSWVVAIVPALALAAGFWAWVSRSPALSTNVTVHRLTDFVGLEEFPAISPDGKSVAFCAHVDGHRQIWVRLLSGGTPLQITHDPADHQSPRWARDSASIIYFSSVEGEIGGAIWEVSALGGSPRRLFSSASGADFDPEGKRIVFFRRGDTGIDLVTASRDGRNETRLASLSMEGYEYSHPRWSPDGRSIAFQRTGGTYRFTNEILVASADGGGRILSRAQGLRIKGLSWLPDANAIIYSLAQTATVPYLPNFNLWMLDLSGGPPRQLTFGEASYLEPDVNVAGTVGASRRTIDFDIWKIPIDGAPEENARRAVPFTRQTGRLATPSPGPDDREIVYLSDSGGHSNIWVSRAGGAEARQLTTEQDPSTIVGLPVWSPDGRHIAFYFLNGEDDELAGNWVMDPDGSNRRYLASGGWSCWSWDSRWLYYATWRDGEYHVEKVSVEGGEPVTVRSDNAFSPAIHPDGKTLFYVVPTTGSFELRKASPENGPSELMLDIPTYQLSLDDPINFQPTVSPDGTRLALFLNDTRGANLWTIDTETGELRRLTDFGEQSVVLSRRASWSSDSRSIFAALGRAEADVVLLAGLLQ